MDVTYGKSIVYRIFHSPRIFFLDTSIVSQDTVVRAIFLFWVT